MLGRLMKRAMLEWAGAARQPHDLHEVAVIRDKNVDGVGLLWSMAEMMKIGRLLELEHEFVIFINAGLNSQNRWC